MGFFKKMLSKDGQSAPPPPPPPPPDAEMDIPPLPPERDFDPGLPNLAPGDSFTDNMPDIPPPQEMPQYEAPPEMPQMEEKKEVSQYDNIHPGIDAAEYEETDLDAVDMDLPLGAVTSDHAADTKGIIPDRRHPDGPIFVKVQDYRGFIEGQERIKNNLKEADNILTRLNEIKNEEDKAFENWRLGLEDINKKVSFVDKKIFEG